MWRAAPDWLTARPIAHRGLHDPAAGIVENTASSVAAAIAAGYGIEVDLQISADGEAMVFHDDTLDRLTTASGALAALTASAIQTVGFRTTADHVLTLPQLLALVAGRAPLILELKSRFDGDTRVAIRTAALLHGYRGPVAAMSFDPTLMTAFRAAAPDAVRGIVAERHYRDDEYDRLSRWQKLWFAHLLHAGSTRPDFVAYGVNDLPAPATRIARLIGLPVLTWTVRTADDMARARLHADQMIFEGFRP